MQCAQIDKLLQQHPAGDLPESAAAHLQSCPDCGRRHRALASLDALLRDTGPADLPPYFHARLAARLRAADLPRPPLPAWAPLTALAAACALVLLLSSLATDITGPGSSVAPITRGHSAAPSPAVLAGQTPHRTAATRIFPV
jgi:hypothetical protein